MSSRRFSATIRARSISASLRVMAWQASSSNRLDSCPDMLPSRKACKTLPGSKLSRVMLEVRFMFLSMRLGNRSGWVERCSAALAPSHSCCLTEPIRTVPAILIRYRTAPGSPLAHNGADLSD